MKIPDYTTDICVPGFAEDEMALQKEKQKRNEHWKRMREAREEWRLLGHPEEEYFTWLEKAYGLVPKKDSQGNITEGYTITNSKLYTLYLLKFSAK